MDSSTRVLDRGALLRRVLRALLLATAAVAAYLALSLLDGPARADQPPVGGLLTDLVDSVDQGVSQQKPLDQGDRPPAADRSEVELKAVDRAPVPKVRPEVPEPAAAPGDRPAKVELPARVSEVAERAVKVPAPLRDRPAEVELPARAPEVAEKAVKVPADVADLPRRLSDRPTRLHLPLADLPALPAALGPLPKLPAAPELPVANGLPAALELPLPDLTALPAGLGPLPKLAAGLELPVMGGLDVPEVRNMPAVLGPLDTGETTVVGAGPVTQAVALTQPAAAATTTVATTTVAQPVTEAAAQVVTDATTTAAVVAVGPAATEAISAAAIRPATTAAEPTPEPIAGKQVDRADKRDPPRNTSAAGDGSDQPAPRPPGEPDSAAGGNVRAGGEGAHDRPGTAGRSVWHPELVASATVIPADTELGGRSADVDPPSG